MITPAGRFESGPQVSIRMSFVDAEGDPPPDDIVPTCAVFDHGGNELFCSFSNGTIYGIHLLNKRFRLLRRFEQPINTLSLHPLLDCLFVCLKNLTIASINSETGKQNDILQGHTAVAHAFTIQPILGTYGISLSDKEAIVWNLYTCNKHYKLEYNAGPKLLAVSFLSPEGELFSACFDDGSIYVYEIETLTCRAHVSEGFNNKTFPKLVSSTAGCLLFVSNGASTIHSWHFPDICGSPIRSLTPRKTELSAECRRSIEISWDHGFVEQVLWLPYLQVDMRFAPKKQCGILLVLTNHGRVLVLAPSSNQMHLNASVCTQSIDWTQHLLSGTVFPEAFAVKLVVPEISCDGMLLPKHTYVVMFDDNGTMYPRSLKQIYNFLNSSPSTVQKNPAKKAQLKSPPVRQSEICPPTELLNCSRLRLLLKEFGQFPNKYRLFIWRTILRLPHNMDAFTALLGKGCHPAFTDLSTRYPIRNGKLIQSLQKICSALAFWCPLLADADWLPLFVFPFVKLLQNKLIHAFELVATVLYNWCFRWFDYFPYPPINVLCLVERLVAHEDPELYRHLVRQQVTTEIYAWPLLQSGFSEVFTESEWLQLWDNIFCNQPVFLVTLVVAYILCARGPLLSIRSLRVFDTFFHGQNAVLVSDVLQKAHQLMETSSLVRDSMNWLSREADSPSSSPNKMTGLHFQPLTISYYPSMMHCPIFVVNKTRKTFSNEEQRQPRGTISKFNEYLQPFGDQYGSIT